LLGNCRWYRCRTRQKGRI